MLGSYTVRKLLKCKSIILDVAQTNGPIVVATCSLYTSISQRKMNKYYTMTSDALGLQNFP